MMFTIVAIQNMMLDYSWAQEEMTSWSVQLKWERANVSAGADSLSEVLASLEAAEEEDVEEETDHMWFTPLVRKKVKGKDAGWKTTTAFHDQDKDFTSVGLRGLPPETLGWCD